MRSYTRSPIHSSHQSDADEKVVLYDASSQHRVRAPRHSPSPFLPLLSIVSDSSLKLLYPVDSPISVHRSFDHSIMEPPGTRTKSLARTAPWVSSIVPVEEFVVYFCSEPAYVHVDDSGILGGSISHWSGEPSFELSDEKYKVLHATHTTHITHTEIANHGSTYEATKAPTWTSRCLDPGAEKQTATNVKME